MRATLSRGAGKLCWVPIPAPHNMHTERAPPISHLQDPFQCSEPERGPHLTVDAKLLHVALHCSPEPGVAVLMPTKGVNLPRTSIFSMAGGGVQRMDRGRERSAISRVLSCIITVYLLWTTKWPHPR